MKPSLQVRLSQHLALTPQLQQSIRLLQLSTLELHQEIEQMLEQNPFLDVEEDHAPMEFGLERVSAPADKSAEREKDKLSEREDSADSSAEEPAGMDAAEFGSTERDDWENGTDRPAAARAAATTTTSRSSRPKPARRCKTTCAANCWACACRPRMPPR